MKRFDKYIFKEFFIPFGYCLAAFILLVIIGNLFENFDSFLQKNIPGLIIYKYSLLLIPQAFIWIAPMSVLLSFIYLLGYMNRYNELNILKGIGVSIHRIMAPFLFVGFIVGILVFGVNEYLVPVCSAGVENIRDFYIKKAPPIGFTKEIDNLSIFNSIYNMSFYIDKLKGKQIQGISIRRFNNAGGLEKEWYAKRAVWIDNNWWLFDGYMRRFNSIGAISGVTQAFKKLRISINISPNDFVYSQKNMGKLGDDMGFCKLHNYIRRNYTRAAVPGVLRIALYNKISLPVTIIVITIFGLGFGMRMSKSGAFGSIGFSIAFYLIYYGLSSMLIAMGRMERLSPVLAVWTPHLVFGAAGMFLITKIR